ncbi:glycosyltransferase [Paenibacillus sp. H1-7]|uniref:glycosyltransferase family 2 protein n=1 Tax=Paenibacillus sp. H1-7 TaxID=2282849 RepID=UPI001EF82C1C|nr:glycosyltransferase [Paenibacillus sp. H1-7]ULL16999.1 glycosyltransferase [Paenibacillus sp. H1-7]
MTIEVSVIMITYNKYPQNLYSLYALENQTFNKKKMEVIMVDDASTDRTPKLKHYRPPFHFRYIRCEQNVGRSKAKNIGVDAARGKILIIMDAEMILDPAYVEQHYKLHQADPNLVVTGCLRHYNAFTVLDRKFNIEQVKLLRQLNRQKNPRYRRLRIRRIFRKYPKKRLFTKRNIAQLKYKKYAYPAPFFREIIERHGTNYEGYHLAYIFVITHNISLRRSTLDKIGPFDEGFKGWGCEDWEFGYRLYKHGVRIVDNPKVSVYHQEHPRSFGAQNKDGLINYQYFFTLHPDFEVGVQALCWIGKNLLEVNDLVVDYKALARQYEQQYPHLIQSFLLLFDTILTLLVNDMPVTNLLNGSETMRDPQWRDAFLAELSQWKASGEYLNLLAHLEWLLSK